MIILGNLCGLKEITRVILRGRQKDEGRDRFGDAMLLVLPMKEGSVNQAEKGMGWNSLQSPDVTTLQTSAVCLVPQDSCETSLTSRTVK